MNHPPSRTRRASAVFGAAVLVYFVAVVHRTALGVAGVEALDRFGTEATGLAMLSVAQIATYAAMQIPAGHLLDRFGPLRMLVAGSILMAIGQAAMAFTDSLGLALVARVLLGAGDAPVFISATRLISAWFPPRRVPVLVQVTGLVGQAGQLATAIPVAWVLYELGWTPAFGVLAGVGLVAAVVAALGIRMPDAGDRVTEQPPDRLWASVRAATATAGNRLGFWSHFVTPFSANVITLLWGVPFFVTAQGRTPAEASGLLVVLTVSAMVSGPTAGVLTARHPLRRSWIVLGSAVATGVAWVALLAFDTPRPLWQLALFCVVLGAGGPISLVGIDFARSWSPVSRLGIASGYVNVGGFASTVVGVLLVGLVLQLASEPGATTYSLDEYRLAFASLLLPWLVGLVGVLRNRRLTRVDLAAEGVVVPPIREAVRRYRGRTERP
ncbi:MAG: MFS transporter [Actinomycetales bacterium]|nr:MFS transporter [Actinomycetales bacterium]